MISKDEIVALVPMSQLVPARYENKTPSEYRLAKKRDGTLILQGAFYWQQGWNNYGYEWREIPIVDLECCD